MAGRFSPNGVDVFETQLCGESPSSNSSVYNHCTKNINSDI